MTIFMVIVAFLLVSLTAISVFFFQKELERRKMVEAVLEKNRTDTAKMEEALKEATKQKSLLEEKLKEAEERLNDVSDELELEKGLREEAKQENVTLKGQLDKLKSEKDSLTSEKNTVQESLIKKLADLEAKLQAEMEAKKLIEQKLSSYDPSYASQSIKTAIPAPESAPQKVVSDKIINATGTSVNLDKIVVEPEANSKGRILSVDLETEFVILNLGSKDGMEIGHVLSVYRGKDYLGDIKVTRVQPDMSAADLIPPFSSRIVRKNDQVILK